MQEDKHFEALKETKKYLEESLKDPAGLLSRQRLFMSALSLGMQHAVELWLHKEKAIKPGATVKHEWFGAEGRRIKLKMAGALTRDINTIQDSDKVLSLSREIERNRNDIIYGSPLPSDIVLKEKLEALLELKKAIENATQIVLW